MAEALIAAIEQADWVSLGSSQVCCLVAAAGHYRDPAPRT
jgi:hypothetical protein